MHRLLLCLAAVVLLPLPALAAAAKKPPPPKAACPVAETTSIGKFGLHQDGVAALPPAERAALKALAARIARSFDAGCTPVSAVELTGHADRDPARGAKFELDISRRRASALRAAIVKELGPQKAGRIAFKVDGVGAAQPKIKRPANEAQRAENRRVAIVTRLGAAPTPPNQCAQPLVSSRARSRKAITGVGAPPLVCIIPKLPVLIRQSYNGEFSRVWFPDGAEGALPLVIYLHGLVPSPPDRKPRPPKPQEIRPGQMMANVSEMDSDRREYGWDFGMNLGALSQALIAGKQTREHIVAAPSEKLADRNGGNLFRKFELGKYVQEIDAGLRAGGGPGVDFDKVLLTGWSGAGCFPGAGLFKIATQKARFLVLGKPHVLMVLGNSDAGVNAGIGAELNKISSGTDANTKTILYSVHKGEGGCVTTADANGAISKQYFDQLGARNVLARPGRKLTATLRSANEEADKAEFDAYQDDGSGSPKRLGFRVTPKGLRKHLPEFVAALAVTEDAKVQRIGHSLVPLVWGFYALPRFLPP